MRRAVSVLLLGVLLLGCKRGYEEAIASKCDASLRTRIEELARTDADSLLDVLGQTSGAIDEARRQKLEAAGAQIREATGEMFTARIAVKKMGGVAALDFVRSLALSQVRDPLSP